jgi:hypothetical protein
MRLGKLTDRFLAAAELAKHLPPGRVAERVKDSIELERIKFNHEVEYSAIATIVNRSVELPSPRRARCVDAER